MENAWKDREGRVWSPRVDCHTLVLFERETGIEILGKIQEFLSNRSKDLVSFDAEKKPVFQATPVLIIEAINHLFGRKFEHLCKAAYLSVIDAATDRKISFDTFLKTCVTAETLPVCGRAFANFFLTWTSQTNPTPPSKDANPTDGTGKPSTPLPDLPK